MSYVAFREFRTWYRIRGDLGAGPTPLLMLNGGPGTPWPDTFRFADEVAASGRPVVVYDQIGCGRSDRPTDRTLWTFELFLDELATVRRELGLDRVHLLGYSWGGMLALQYMLGRPTGVEGLVLSSSPFNVPLWVTEARRLRAELPAPSRRAMDRYERTHPAPLDPAAHGPAKSKHEVKPGLTTAQIQRRAKAIRRAFGMITAAPVQRVAAAASAVPFLRRPAYDVVGLDYMRRHVCRADPVPDEIFESIAGANLDLYETMWGPGEYYATGSLTGWDVTDRLGGIGVPTLITSGRYDEATPTQMEMLRDGIPGSRWELFEDSAHMAIVEEPDRYRTVVQEFLDKLG